MRKLRGKLTYANVMVTILAFVVLCGGAAVAAGQLGKNTVGTKQLKKNAVTSAKVKDRSLQASDLSAAVLKQFAPKQPATGPTGPQGPQGIPGPEGPRGPSNGYQAQGEVNELSASLYANQVVSLSVPPGDYLAIATVEADTADGLNGAIQCRLINGEGGGGSTVVSRLQSIRYPDSENMTLTSEFSVQAGQALNLQCSRLGPSALVRALQANVVAVRLSEFAGHAG